MAVTASILVVLIVASSTLCAPTVEQSLTNIEQSVADLRKTLLSGRPRDCADLYISGQNHSGVFNIFPYEGSKPAIATYCDMESDGGGWTVFQRRGQFGNTVYDFYRDWKAYKNGFGDPAKEFWLGNDLIHVMTSNKAMSLRIVLTNRTGETFAADYASFKIAGEKEQYKLIVSGYTGAKGYDAFSQANGSRFSTFDRDYDMSRDSNCAVTYRGAWWYTSCHVANLNGLNLAGAHASFADGIEWSIRGGIGSLYHYSFPQVEMKIRERSFGTLAAGTADAYLEMAVTASTLVVLIVASSALCAPTVEQSLTNIEQSVADLRKALLSGRPRDCADLYISGQNHSGVFNIFPYEGSKPAIATYCDMESDGGGWTVFQRRGQFGNPVYDFYRDWKAYKNGFGDPAKEFWLGNQLIHVMTSNKATSLRIVLTNRTGETFTADYALFKIAGENELYKLIVSGYTGAKGYDAFSQANGSSFSTFDKDNDMNPDGNCAVTYRGAWWYTRCHVANLNGLNLAGAHASFADGIEWSIRGGVGGLYHYSYPQVEMKMRDASFETLTARIN
ncbi:protein scabrous-like [Ornithodoros turicata]|uniref:protein scabrous-like n=1 Tax=Ornithodoros turicata TaxID=34597 RepID=UPI00313A46BC